MLCWFWAAEVNPAARNTQFNSLQFGLGSSQTQLQQLQWLDFNCLILISVSAAPSFGTQTLVVLQQFLKFGTAALVSSSFLVLASKLSLSLAAANVCRFSSLWGWLQLLSISPAAIWAAAVVYPPRFFRQNSFLFRQHSLAVSQLVLLVFKQQLTSIPPS